MRFKWKLQSDKFFFFKNYVLVSDVEMTSLNFVTYNINCVGDKIEKNEIGWACGAYG